MTLHIKRIGAADQAKVISLLLEVLKVEELKNDPEGIIRTMLSDNFETLQQIVFMFVDLPWADFEKLDLADYIHIVESAYQINNFDRLISRMGELLGRLDKQGGQTDQSTPRPYNISAINMGGA